MKEGTDLGAGGASNDDARATAASWFARAVSGEMGEAETAALARWRAADTAHDAEYRALLDVWHTAGRVPAAALRAMATPDLASAPWTRSMGLRAMPPRRAAAMALATAAVVVLGGGVAVVWRNAHPVYTAQLEAARGERRSLTLPDGSTVEANTQTRLDIRFYRDRRVVVLVRGEASFDVARDAARPCTVEAGAAQVRVTGTSFAVRLDGGTVRTVVLHGTVEVRGVGAAAAGPSPRRLTAGLATTVDPSGVVAPATPLDVAALTAWREGRIVFDNTALADALVDVARYRTRPIRLADPALGRLRLSGTFRIDDTDALLAALPLVLPVTVRRDADGGAEIAAH